MKKIVLVLMILVSGIISAQTAKEIIDQVVVFDSHLAGIVHFDGTWVVECALAAVLNLKSTYQNAICLNR